MTDVRGARVSEQRSMDSKMEDEGAQRARIARALGLLEAGEIADARALLRGALGGSDAEEVVIGQMALTPVGSVRSCCLESFQEAISGAQDNLHIRPMANKRRRYRRCCSLWKHMPCMQPPSAPELQKNIDGLAARRRKTAPGQQNAGTPRGSCGEQGF